MLAKFVSSISFIWERYLASFSNIFNAKNCLYDSFTINNPVFNYINENYILNCSPRYEFDPYWNWANKACNELDIPYKETDKRSVKRSDGTRLPCDVEISDYYKLISECTFTIVSESCTSTGGLGNLEALNLGKKCISNKKNGLINYCGDFADYFDTYEELKNLIKYNWENRNFRSVEDCKNHCYNFTPEKTAERFYKELLWKYYI